LEQVSSNAFCPKNNYPTITTQIPAKPFHRIIVERTGCEWPIRLDVFFFKKSMFICPSWEHLFSQSCMAVSVQICHGNPTQPQPNFQHSIFALLSSKAVTYKSVSSAVAQDIEPVPVISGEV
jgi:hypothetical protein